MISGGIDLPSYSTSLGLKSKRSSWLVAPAMNRWITRVALGAKCGGLGESGLTPDAAVPRERNASVSSDASAILPTPTPQSRKKWRRVTASAVDGAELMMQFLGGRPGSAELRA